MITYIYCLADPRTDEIRYVGKANDPAARLASHVHECSRVPLNQRTHRHHWLYQLKSAGLRPKLELLEIVDSASWEAAERAWIRSFRELDIQLVNATDGGGGHSGLIPSAETCQKRSESLKRAYAEGRRQSTVAGRFKGRTHTDESRRKMSEGVRRVYQDPDFRARVSKGRKGRKTSAVTREKQRIASTGKHHTPEACEKIRQSRLGKKASVETRKRLSDAHRGQVITAETRKKISEANRGKKRSPEAIEHYRVAAKLRCAKKREAAVALREERDKTAAAQQRRRERETLATAS